MVRGKVSERQHPAADDSYEPELRNTIPQPKTLSRRDPEHPNIPYLVPGDSGMAAIGKPIPERRLTEALRHLREMVPDVSTGDAMTLIGAMAVELEADQPYQAMKRAEDLSIVDLTGRYRLMAVLLSDP